MRIAHIPALAGVLLLSACGGDGGSSSPAPIPTPPPAPTPAPTPTPTPATYDTPEYRLSNAAVQHNALAAFVAGASGAGVTVGFIDSGIDQASAEFSGRISPLSRDVVSGRGIQDVDGHGTSVAAVLGAARDNNFIEGIAPQSTLLVLRAEQDGTCPKCSFYDNNIADGIDAAVAGHARVINISLGGTAASPTLNAAISRATAAGVLIVIAAGNESMAQPDAFALGGVDPTISNGAYIIAGAVDQYGALADFSNRAGSAQNIYLAALGVDVLSIGISGKRFLFSGTSYATPVIAGAAALLAGAFPNLTGRQIADLLLSSADDAGAPGTDDQFGRGILNIGRAFAPKGSTALAGSAIPVALSGINAAVGGPLGNGAKFGAALSGAIVLDSYGRAYSTDLGRTLGRAPRPGLAGALLGQSLSATVGSASHTLSLTVSPGADVRPWLGFGQRGLDALGSGGTPSAGIVRTQLWRGAELGLAMGLRLDALAPAGSTPLGFVAAPGDSLTFGTALRSANAVQAVQHFGGWRVALGAGNAQDQRLTRALAGLETAQWQLGVGRRIGAGRADVALEDRQERGGLLGTTLGAAFGVRSAHTRTLALTGAMPLAYGWRASGVLRHGWTDATFAPGLLTGLSGVRSLGYRLDLARENWFAAGDSFALRFAQPMRVVDGVARLLVPDTYDYATLVAHLDARSAALAPGGTERDVEAVYARGFAWGRVGGHLFWRADPDHVAGANDGGAALTVSAGF